MCCCLAISGAQWRAVLGGGARGELETLRGLKLQVMPPSVEEARSGFLVSELLLGDFRCAGGRCCQQRWRAAHVVGRDCVEQVELQVMKPLPLKSEKRFFSCVVLYGDFRRAVAAALSGDACGELGRCRA